VLVFEESLAGTRRWHMLDLGEPALIVPERADVLDD
jgi:hypothetical protein